MKKIYIAVLLALVLSIILFFASFAFLDAIKHKTYYYTVSLNGKDVGTVKIDRFITDERIIYKSVTSVPFEPLYTEYRSRLSLDKHYELESYTKERSTGRVTDVYYIENFKHLISFVSRYQSKFALLDNIPIRKQTFYFEDDSPVTYLPILENYNFSKGRSQGFNAISCLFSWNLPPVKRFVTLTSIRDEFIKIGSKKIEAENLILKMRDYPQGMIWVSKSDRSLLKLDIPLKGVVITRSFSPKSIRAKERFITPRGYAVRDVSFKGSKSDLSGILTYPSRSGAFPAVVLVHGAGSQDKQCQGMFASMADYLSMNGYAVLRFDKRITGSVTGDSLNTTDTNEIADVKAALQFMESQSCVEPGRVVVIGHGRGAIYALRAATDNSSVKGLVMMAPDLPVSREELFDLETMQKNSLPGVWPDNYRVLVARGAKEVLNTLGANDGDFVYILGKKCYLSDMREELADKPLEDVSKLKAPVLILQGSGVDSASRDAALIDQAIADSGSIKHTLTYYAYLGQYFGSKVSDGINRTYYETDPGVLETVKDWIGEVI